MQFINTATGWTLATVGHDLNSCTQDVYSITCPHPDGSGRNVVFVDTPGFDDSGNMSDYDVLKAIANWLKQT
jgi:GTPase Era involved in 16S rRNA processing